MVVAAGDVFYTTPGAPSCLRLNCATASEEELVTGLEVVGRIVSIQPAH